MSKLKIFAMLSLCLLAFSGWYSFGQFEMAKANKLDHLNFLNRPANQPEEIFPDVDLSKISELKVFSSYHFLDDRNIFGKYAPKKLEIKMPELVEAPKRTVKLVEKIEVPQPVVVVPEAPKTIFLYQGLVEIEGEEVHIVMQENPYKTHFLRKDDSKMKNTLEIIEIGRYGLTIRDEEGTEHQLTLKKE